VASGRAVGVLDPSNLLARNAESELIISLFGLVEARNAKLLLASGLDADSQLS
jgi:hypothetical protein